MLNKGIYPFSSPYKFYKAYSLKPIGIDKVIKV